MKLGSETFVMWRFGRFEMSSVDVLTAITSDFVMKLQRGAQRRPLVFSGLRGLSALLASSTLTAFTCSTFSFCCLLFWKRQHSCWAIYMANNSLPLSFVQLCNAQSWRRQPAGKTQKRRRFWMSRFLLKPGWYQHIPHVSVSENPIRICCSHVLCETLNVWKFACT